MQKKYQIFISSTYRDLIEERNDIAKAVLEMDHIPSGMETFLSADEEQFAYIKKIIDQCDYYILLIAGKYGTISADGLSYTEKEYDYAKASGKVILGFINNNISKLPLEKVDTNSEAKQKLEDFIKKISSGRLVTFWSDRNDLKSSVIISLSKAFFQNPRVGWIRGNVAATEDVLSQINGLRTENDALKAQVEELKSQLAMEASELADFNDPFTIHYRNTSSTETTVQLTWREIFMAVAPDMASYESYSDSHITHHIAKKLSNFIVESYNCTVWNYSIRNNELNIIRFHFVALGLMELAEKGTIRLTSKGGKTLIETMAARKPQ